MFPKPLLDRFQTWLWTRPANTLVERAALAMGRYSLALVRDLLDGDINLRAMSLVYTSLLSLVPFLAIAFSLLKALGVHNSLQPVLMKLLSAFGNQADELTQAIIGFVDNIKVGVLGIVGVTLLLYTAVSLIYKVEASFNFLWRRPGSGGIPQRFGEYLGLLLVGPLLLFAALGITGTVLNNGFVTELRSIEPFGTALLLITKLLPYAMMIGMFTFLYAYIPAAKVGVRAAAIGGLTAGIAWQMASAAFARFASGAGNYNAIYSGFAIVIFLLLWLYLSWLILLCGCRISYYAQNPRQMIARGAPGISGSRETDWAALSIAISVYRGFSMAETAPTLASLRQELGAPDDLIAHCISGLIEAGVLAERASDGGLLPARDADSLTVGELWLRARGPAPVWALGAPSADGITDQLHQLEQAAAQSGKTESVRTWLARLNTGT